MSQAIIQLPKKLANLPVVVTGTWDGAQKMWSGAKLCEELKLYFQVMTGLELLALQSQHNAQGQRTDLTSSHSEKKSFTEILEEKMPFSQATAYRVMEMATGALPRIRKNLELKDFDPATTPMNKLTESARDALASTVKKLTDGKSQTDFFEGLYKNGGAGGGREAGCDNTRKNLSLSEELALRQKLATKQWKAMAKLAAAYQDKFTVLTDHEVEAQMAVLEQALNARKAWLKQPVNDRKPKVIAEMFRGGAK